ncbi:MAG: hypothetical protein Q4A60_03400 [Pasteurellaceae bacterium]|nr:hypothetical protein [Pasteurellaceae bacterium]
MQRSQQDFASTQAGLDRSHQHSLTQLQGNINYNNQSRLNQAQNQFSAQQAGLDRTHQMGMQTAQHNFVSTQAGLDRTHQTNMAKLNSELQHNNAMKELGSQVSANTIGKSIDFSMQIHNNFDAQIAAVQTNTQMTKENKEKAINQLLESRNIQLKFLQDFMQNIPTKHQNWTNFPSLEFPTINPSQTTLGNGQTR